MRSSRFAPITGVAHLGRFISQPRRWFLTQSPLTRSSAFRWPSVPRLVAAGGFAVAGVQIYGAAGAECEPTAAIGEPPSERRPPPTPPPLSPGGEFQKQRVLCLHGINLNMFGKRDAATYGTATLMDINTQMAALATELGVELETFQTNSEGEMVDRIHRAHVLKEWCMRLPRPAPLPTDAAGAAAHVTTCGAVRLSADLTRAAERDAPATLPLPCAQ